MIKNSKYRDFNSLSKFEHCGSSIEVFGNELAIFGKQLLNLVMAR